MIASSCDCKDEGITTLTIDIAQPFPSPTRTNACTVPVLGGNIGAFIGGNVVADYSSNPSTGTTKLADITCGFILKLVVRITEILLNSKHWKMREQLGLPLIPTPTMVVVKVGSM